MARNSVPIVTAVLAWLACTSASPAQPRVDALGDPLPEGAIARLGTTRMRHFSTPDHYVWGLGCITWSPDGKMIATTSYSDKIGIEARLWEASTGKPQSVLENNTRYGPSFVRFTHDNKTLAAAAGQRIVLWDVATGKEIGQLLGHQDEVDAFVFQDGGKTMVSVSRDAVVQWWDVPGRKAIRHWQLLANDPQKTDKGKPILFRGTRNVCFSADGKTLAFNKWWATRQDKIYNDNMAIVFDLSAQKELWHEDTQVYDCRFAFTPDGKHLALSYAASFRLHEAATGRRLTSLQHIHAWGMDFSPAGETLALRTGGITLWSDDKTPVRQLPLPHHNGCSKGPTFSPDGKKVAVEIGRTFQVLDVAAGKPAVAWPSYDGGIQDLAFSADGRNLLADDLSIDTATWRPRAAPENPLWKKFDDLQAVSRDRAFCVAADGEHKEALFDVKTGRVLAHLKLPDRDLSFHNGFFSPQARVYVLQARSCAGRGVDTLFAVPSGKQLWQLSFDEHARTCSWSFSEDESRVACFERGTGKVYAYQTATGKLLLQVGTGGLEGSLALSPDGNMLAVWREGLRDVQILALRTGKQYGSLTLKQDAGDFDHACFAWSPDNRMLAVGGLDNSVRLWEMASGQVRREFRGHQAQVTCLAFSRDGRLLASGSDDTTLMIWTVRPEK
jgi:WD40 repeat protein